MKQSKSQVPTFWCECVSILALALGIPKNPGMFYAASVAAVASLGYALMVFRFHLVEKPKLFESSR